MTLSGGFTGETEAIIIFLWNHTFNVIHNVTYYKAISSLPTTLCPRICYPTVPCRCIGLDRERVFYIEILAANCGYREGTAMTIAFTPQGSSYIGIASYIQ